MKLLITLISFIIIMLGIIAIFDARKLSKKWFSFYNQNEGVKCFKIGGFIFSIIGTLILYFTFL